MDFLSESHILSQICPTVASQRLRLEVIQIIRRNVEKCLSHFRPHLAIYGSFPLQTYLPTGDLDLTIIIPQTLSEAQVVNVLSTVRSQMEFVARIRPMFEIKNFLEVNAEVKVLKFQVKGVAVDLSVNQTGGLFTLRLFEFFDSLTPDHLFKRALLIVKAWATYESRVAGSQFGLLASYALGVLVMSIINCYPESRTSPLQVLSKLLQVYGDLDWERSVVTCFGVMTLEEYLQGEKIGTISTYSLLFTQQHLQQLTCAPLTCVSFPRKFVNLADPLKPENNLGRSVGRGTFERLRFAFQVSSERLHDFGPMGLFHALCKPARPVVSGDTSRSTNSDSEEERFQFTNELDAVQKALQQALAAPPGQTFKPVKPWMTSVQQHRIRVANR